MWNLFQSKGPLGRSAIFISGDRPLPLGFSLPRLSVNPEFPDDLDFARHQEPYRASSHLRLLNGSARAERPPDISEAFQVMPEGGS